MRAIRRERRLAVRADRRLHGRVKRDVTDFCPLRRACGLLAAAMPLLAEPALRAEAAPAWDERLAEAFSPAWREARREAAALPGQLALLPDIPVDDQGGTGGYAALHPAGRAAGGSMHAAELRWGKAEEIDAIALVPARRYDAKGLDPHYGMPDDFTVELLDEEGGRLRVVAREWNTRGNPARRGHPFYIRVDPPVACHGLRIVAGALRPDEENEGSHVHAWAECFVFQGSRNVAVGAEVKVVGGSPASAAWLWQPDFLIDGQTPLGLPEVPAAEHRHVGWLSNGRPDPEEPSELSVDLGAVVRIDLLRLLPARRPTSDLPSGFGFPRALEIFTSSAERPGAGDWSAALRQERANPGHNPVEFRIEAVEARHVKLRATRLWKAYESYPAFFALSEVEVWAGGENRALGRPVRSSDGMQNLIGPGGRHWSGAALSDGYGPDGRLVTAREWLERLDERLQLETRLQGLQAEAAERVAAWRRGVWTGLVLCGTAGAVALVALPIRYRSRARRDLLQVRERIAGDLHDEVGSNLGSIQMLADLAEGRSGPSDELKRIQRIASETVSAVRDIVWLLRPGGDHRIGTVEHLRETASIMLESLDWHFHADEAAWQVEFPEETNRHLFLYFREALHNILRHSGAVRVEIQVAAGSGGFRLEIRDDGCGISEEKRARPATHRALRQRAEALAGRFSVESPHGGGTWLVLDFSHPGNARRSKKHPAGNTAG